MAGGPIIESRDHQRYTRGEDRIVARRRFNGEPAKAIARDLNRSPTSVHSRFRTLMRKLERAHPDVLDRHRQEELALLERLLAESRKREVAEA